MRIHVPYFIANVTARYQLLQSLSVFGRVGNLFDTSYETAFDRVGSPVMTNLKVTFDGLEVKDVYPPAIPDVFRGE